MSQGQDMFHTVLPPEQEARTDVLRLTFSWDAPARTRSLTVERPESGQLRRIDTPPPPPLELEDIYTITHRPQLTDRDPPVHALGARDAGSSEPP